MNKALYSLNDNSISFSKVETSSRKSLRCAEGNKSKLPKRLLMREREKWKKCVCWFSNKQKIKSALFQLALLILQNSQTIRKISLVVNKNLWWFTSPLNVPIFLLYILLTHPVDTPRVLWNYLLDILNSPYYLLT